MKMDALGLLGDLFENVAISSGVFIELTSNEKFQDEATQIRECGFIHVCHVPDEGEAMRLQNMGLDLGESESIVLAQTTETKLLLMDEKRGRKKAKELGLDVVGTIDILLSMREHGLVYHAQLCIFIQDIKKHRRFISQELLDDLFALSVSIDASAKNK
ncbi:hypothetical protein [Helicobacter bizzozeronii]|uniref:hypothetical protein n=2 Tax=Helicobacter bizzozeronii TaxID=56877 RepID=UPI001F2B9BA8|nr:hypothetical protein [Helicobacter bizzozeronii]